MGVVQNVIDIRTLGEALADLGTIEAGTVTASVGTVSGNTTLKRNGSVVCLGLQMSGVTASTGTWTKIASVSDECKPSTAFSGFYYSQTGNGQIKINVNGNVEVYPHTALSASNVFANLSWII